VTILESYHTLNLGDVPGFSLEIEVIGNQFVHLVSLCLCNLILRARILIPALRLNHPRHYGFACHICHIVLNQGCWRLNGCVNFIPWCILQFCVLLYLDFLRIVQ
jgi:hypothetical protein